MSRTAVPAILALAFVLALVILFSGGRGDLPAPPAGGSATPAPSGETPLPAAAAPEAASAPAAGTSTLSLLVVTDRGDPVPDATVTVTAWGAPGADRVRGRTGADGRADLPGLRPGTAGIEVGHDDFATAGFRIFLPRDGVYGETVVLETASAATGRVVDAATGAPIPGARVREGFRGRERVTGTDGSFVFPNYTRDYDSLTVCAEGYARASAYVPLEGEMLIRLSPETVVRGRLVGTDGAPVPAGTVRLTGYVAGDLTERYTSLDVTAASATDGAFALRGLREGGPFTVVAQAEGFGRTIVIFETSGIGGSGRDRDLGDLVLPPGRTLRGRVIDAAGTPAASVAVTAAIAPPVTMRTVTGPDGAFSFAGLAPGEVRLATEPGASLPARARVVVPEEGDPAEIVLRLPGGRDFTVKVLDPDGRPLPGALVTVGWLGDGTAGATGQDGTVTFTGFPPDVADLEVDVRPADGPRAPEIFRTLWTVALDRGGVTIPLRRAAFLEGICVDPEGNPLPMVGIRVQTAGGELAGYTGAAGRDGRFRLVCAEGGVVNLGFGVSAKAPRGAERYRDRSFRTTLFGVRAPRTEMRVVLLPVAADSTLRVAVTDEAGGPVPGAEVRAEGTESISSGRTGPDGRVELAGVETGYVHLFVTPEPGTVSPLVPVPWVEVFDVRTKTTVTLRLTGGEVISGVVLGPDGMPMAGVRVTGGHHPERRGEPVVTDGRGEFRAVVTPTGRAFLQATWQDEGGEYYLAQAPAPTGTRNVVLRLGHGPR